MLVVAERKGRTEAESAETRLNRLRSLPLITDHDQDDANTVALARQHNLSGYDAAYLETAHRRQAQLATLDKKLSKATHSIEDKLKSNDILHLDKLHEPFPCPHIL